MKSVKSTKYKHVYHVLRNGKDLVWCFQVWGSGKKFCDTEREAAIAADKYLISKRKEPVNILVRK
ncbi:MAG: hypothetical protein KBC56_04815 [Flavobacterium sp.]|nr:hypothetical protein [Flavobacterium sp.]